MTGLNTSWGWTCAALLVLMCSTKVTAEKVTLRHPEVRGTQRDHECLVCHAGKGQEDAPKLALGAYNHAAHEKVGCVSCHKDVEDPSIRHDRSEEDLRHVECGRCHEQEGRKYLASSHATKKNGPTCATCHGDHAILSPRNPRASTHPLHLLETCGKCHGEERTAAGHTIKVPEQYRKLLETAGDEQLRSLMAQSTLVSASCVDCHGPHQNSPASDAGSSLHPAQAVDTCGRCHQEPRKEFSRSVHAEALRKQSLGQALPAPHKEAPSCITCHAMHAKRYASAPSSDAFRLNIVRECGTCHAEMYKSYQESYHGQATLLGSVRVAKCSDCHGNHEIRRPKDPRSSVNAQNKLQTCRSCHKTAPENFASFAPHADPHDRARYPGLFWVWAFMTGLMVSVFSFFGLHTFLWGVREAIDAVRERGRTRIVHATERIERFALFHRITHAFVIVSFLGLTATGAPLKFASTPWAKALFEVIGGVSVAGWLHRLFGIITFGYLAMHVGFVVRRLMLLRGQGLLGRSLIGPDSLIPQLGDLKDIIAHMRWFLGVGPKPEWDRWTYWEKFDYWSVFWGVAIIGGTGLVLWFPGPFTYLVPGWVVNVALVVHSDEALMAIGFIFGVHFFNSHLRRSKFPMDAVIFTGSVPEDEYREERGKQWARLQKEGGLEHLRREAPDPRFLKWARVFGISAWLIGLTLLGLILHGVLSN